MLALWISLYTRNDKNLDFKKSIRIIDEPSQDEKSGSRMPSGYLDSHRSLVIKITGKKIDL